MKKVAIVFRGLILCLFCWLIFSVNNVQADSYKITDYNEQIYIQKDGSADIDQRVTYEFNGEYHGVYNKVDIKDFGKMSVPSVELLQDGTSTAIDRVPYDPDYYYNDTFEFTGKKIKQIKVYHQITDDEAAFVYRYHLQHVVTAYNDTAAINWKVIADNWDVGMDHATVTLHLPQKNVTGLKSWTHGPLTGYTSVNKENGTVRLSVDNLPEDTYVTTQTIFPNLVTPSNTNKVDKNQLKYILAEEKDAAEKANSDRFWAKFKTYGLMWLYVIVLVVGLFMLFHYMKTLENVIKPTKLHHFFDAPDMKPSTARMLIKRSHKADNHGLTGDMMMEVVNKNLKIRQTMDDTYEIIRETSDCDEIFNDMIDKIGDGKKVSFDEIKESVSFQDQFKDWQERSKDDREKYFSSNNQLFFDGMHIGSAVVLGLGGLMAYFCNIWMTDTLKMTIPLVMIGVLIALVANIYFHINYDIYNQFGVDKVNEVKAFRRMLKDINDIEIAKVGDLILWERYLPFAAAFGISKKIIRALKLEFGQVIEDVPIINYYSYGLATYSASSNFNMTVSAGSGSSVSGGSGGFSGGGSGGSGGGGGGGAF